MNNIIAIDEDRFYELLASVIRRTETQRRTAAADEWLTPAQAMKLLNVKRTKLYLLRINGNLRYSQDGRRILYQRESILAYIEQHVKEPFDSEQSSLP